MLGGIGGAYEAANKGQGGFPQNNFVNDVKKKPYG